MWCRSGQKARLNILLHVLTWMGILTRCSLRSYFLRNVWPGSLTVLLKVNKHFARRGIFVHSFRPNGDDGRDSLIYCKVSLSRSNALRMGTIIRTIKVTDCGHGLIEYFSSSLLRTPSNQGVGRGCFDLSLR